MNLNRRIAGNYVLEGCSLRGMPYFTSANTSAAKKHPGLAARRVMVCDKQ